MPTSTFRCDLTRVVGAGFGFVAAAGGVICAVDTHWWDAAAACLGIAALCVIAVVNFVVRAERVIVSDDIVDVTDLLVRRRIPLLDVEAAEVWVDPAPVGTKWRKPLIRLRDGRVIRMRNFQSSGSDTTVDRLVLEINQRIDALPPG